MRHCHCHCQFRFVSFTAARLLYNYKTIQYDKMKKKYTKSIIQFQFQEMERIRKSCTQNTRSITFFCRRRKNKNILPTINFHASKSVLENKLRKLIEYVEKEKERESKRNGRKQRMIRENIFDWILTMNGSGKNGKNGGNKRVKRGRTLIMLNIVFTCSLKWMWNSYWCSTCAVSELFLHCQEFRIMLAHIHTHTRAQCNANKVTR